MKKTILTIVLAMLCSFFCLRAQDHGTITGTIYTQDRKPLAGVTIKIMDTDINSITDENGKFSLVCKVKKGTLMFSYMGYETQYMDFIMGRTDNFSVFMREHQDQLQEVEINAGYYNVKERERTGSISRVTSETIGKQPINNPLMVLQGNIPGVQVTQNSGIPGGAFTVRIRGSNSLKSGNDPLYIIDGVPYPSTGISSNASASTGTSPLSMINPGDIESMEILKDADATSIYGSRGANGVILISTKKGKEGLNKINAGFSHGVSQVAHRIDLLNTEEYLQMRREAFNNDGLQPGTSDYDVNGTWDPGKYTDWQKELIGGISGTTNASLNISGGHLKSNYLIAANYFKEGSVYPGDFGFERMGIRSNIHLGAQEDPLNASLTLNFNHSINKLSPNITESILLPPNAPDLLDQYGKLNWSDNTVYTNPMASILRKNQSLSDGLIGNLTLSYKISGNLKIKTDLGYTTIRREELIKTPLASYPPAYGFTAEQRSSLFGNNVISNFVVEPQLNYNLKTRSGKIDALIGMSLQSSKSKIDVIRASGFNSDDLLENMGSSAMLSYEQNEFSQYRYIAGFGRINYSLLDRYFFNLTARRDGSSRFGKGRQFANFGALGAAWIISDEHWFKNAPKFLSFAKLRSSYGLTGNDQIGNYGYLPLWDSYIVYDGSSTLVPGYRAANSDFAWETNRKLEAALQLGFLKDRFRLEFSVYRNRSSSLLLDKFLPLSIGQTAVYRNLPAKVQNTGFEFDLDLKILNSPVFQWSADFNLTIPKNQLLSYPGLETSNDASFYEIGKPLNIIKTYNVTVNTQTGIYDFEDKNNNGVIDNGDRYLTSFLGQRYFGGLHNSLRYKNFTFDFLFSFAKQNGRRFDTTYSPGRNSAGATSNQYAEVLMRWQKQGDESQIQKFSTLSANNNLYNSNKYYGSLSVVDASFLRLRNISINYSLPGNLLSALKISNAYLFLQGQNVFTLTNYIGLDPETQGMALPPLRTVMMGLNITF